METKKYMFYSALVLALLACSVLGGSSDNNPDESVPNAPDSGGEVSSGESGSSGSSLLPGPASLDLSSPALYTFASNYTSQVVVVFDGAAQDGSPLTQTITIDQKMQTIPTESNWMKLSTALSNEEQTSVIETATIDGQTYSFLTDAGCFVIPADSSQDTFGDLFTVDGLFVNQASRVETGVQINGFTTDGYELTSDNIDSSHDEFDSQFTFTQGMLYVARDGGFITQLLLEGQTYMTDYEGFDPNVETPANFTFNYIPVEGALGITPPAGCADQVGSGDSYPLMDDAAQVSALPGTTFYQTNHTLQEVLDFYKAEMPAQGWSLTDESSIGGFASLTFTKEGQTISVMPVQNGDVVSVSIVEQ
jgi:hypothetical protein